MLPGLGGLELLERLRKTRKTPVLILTARDAVGDRVQGLDAGADDYVLKPFALSELLARLRALIRRSAGLADPVIRIGDVAIDTAHADGRARRGRRIPDGPRIRPRRAAGRVPR